MSRRFGRNQKRKLIATLQTKDKVVEVIEAQKEDLIRQLNDVSGQWGKSERRRDAIGRELSHILERNLQPKVDIRFESGVRRSVGVDLFVRNNRQALAVSYNIDAEVLYMLAGPEARAQLAGLVLEKLVNVLSRGGGTRIDL